MKLTASIAKYLGIVTSAATLCACSATSVLNHLNGAGDYRTHENIHYGPKPRQRLDVYQPQPNEGQHQGCVVVFVYGGGWDSGRKEQYGFVGAQLAQRGHTVAIPDYRLYPEVTYPEFVHDIALATASETVTQLRHDKPLVMMGHSAGAMIAGLVSFDDRYLKAQGLNPSIIDGYISLAGPHDFFLPSDKKRWVNIFGADNNIQRSALTVEHIHPSNPPTLILHGEDDGIVTPKSAKSLEQKLNAAGVKATRKTYPGVGHVRLMAAMGWPLHFLAPTLEDVAFELEGLCGGDR